ncbi:uroporphyrinogen decarboxylase family protein [Chloroflexota bacterium]
MFEPRKGWDKAESAERLMALLNGEHIYRVPVWLWILGCDFAARMAGFQVADIYQDVEKSFWAQVWTQDMYGSDDIPRTTFGAPALTFGGEVKAPTDKYDMGMRVSRHPVESEEDALKLRLPDDIKTVPPINFQMQFARLQEKYGYPITVWCESPLDLVAQLCGISRLCRWLIKKPELVHHLLRFAVAYRLKVLRYWADTFSPECIIVVGAAPITANTVISPKHFEAFNMPYHKELNEKIMAMGIKHIFCHLCGDHTKNLPLWAQIPMGNPGILSFGHDVDLSEAVKHLGDKNVICGNVDPAVIVRGTPEQAYQLSQQCIEKAKDAPRGFILMPGCAIPSLTSPYNVYMLKKAADDFGRY